MGKWVKFWVLIIAVAGFSFAVYSQDPPEPQMQSQSDPSTGDGPCGRDDNPGQGSPPPPPPGLCLPINDYLFPLFLSGVALGAFSLFYLQKKKEATTAE